MQIRQSQLHIAVAANGQAEADRERGEDTNPQGPEGQFDFLGYTFGRTYSARTGQAYLGRRRREEPKHFRRSRTALS